MVWANDSSPAACRVYSRHFQHRLSEGDIWDRLDVIPPHDLLMAGLPCQSFSSAGQKSGVADIRGTMFSAVADVLCQHRPAGFVLENVPNVNYHRHEAGGLQLGFLREADPCIVMQQGLLHTVGV